MARVRVVVTLLVLLGSLIWCAKGQSQGPFEKDVITTKTGRLVMKFIGHGTLMFEFQGKVIHIDPVFREADYQKMPKADLILVTHEHGDHLDVNAIAAIRKEDTKLFLTESCVAKGVRGKILRNGDVVKYLGMTFEAIPAYNLVHERSKGKPFHPKGVGNGYVLTIDDKRIYVAGDTENTPEMKALKNIDIAFLPMNLPYTMTPEMVADAARAIRPKALYPYHFGKTDTSMLVELLKNYNDIEVRIRKMD